MFGSRCLPRPGIVRPIQRTEKDCIKALGPIQYLTTTDDLTYPILWVAIEVSGKCDTFAQRADSL